MSRSFADTFRITLGDAVVVGRRLTIGELKSHWSELMEERLDIAAASDIVRSHTKLENGEAVEPEALTLDQLRKLVAELTLPKEGRGISDFIGLLC
jgi:hypothetical protein